MIPQKVINVMKLVIESRSFSPALTKMCFKKQENTFFWSDSFTIFEFKPHTIVWIDDFSLTKKQLNAISLLTKKWMLSFWGMHTLWDKKIIEMNTDDWQIYFPIIDHSFPEVKQETIFWVSKWEVSNILASDQFVKFTKAVNMLDWYKSVSITDKTYFFEMEDDFGRYKLACRLPKDK